MRPNRLFVALLFFALCSGMAWADSPVGVSRYFDDDVQFGKRTPGQGGVIDGTGPGLQAAADYIVSIQCSVGGWCWPSGTGCCPNPPSNTQGPILLGLLSAYAHTGDPSHLAAAELAGTWDMASQYTNGEYRSSAASPWALHSLSVATGDSTYSDWTATEFFDELTAGTYGPSDIDTYGWIGAVQAGRSGAYINLRPWEFSDIAPTAAAVGNANSTSPADGVSQGQAFINAILDGLNTLDSTTSTYWDYIGLAGGVYGLAATGTTTFPVINAPNSAMVDGIDNLCDLANALANEQNSDGSWDWHSNITTPDPTDADTQNTAYAVMALVAAQDAGCGPYDAVIAKARDWLRSMQNADGSFQPYPGGDVNTEVDAEAADALIPDDCVNNKLVLEVPSASACVTQGEQVTVELWQRNLSQPVRGYQAWLQFDSLQMAFHSGTYTATPFGLPVLAIAADGNNLDLAAGLTSTQSPTSADALLATLVFDTALMPDGPTVVSFRDRQPPTRFTDETGQPVEPCLVASTTILIDGTAPVIVCPGNVTIQCNESTDPSNTGSATATDNLDDTPVVTWSDAVDMSGCGGYTGTITRTWTAEDCAGNTTSCVQTITVVDTIDPVITCPVSVIIECDESTDPLNTGNATATDICDPAPVITYIDSVAPGACADEEVITRTWTATDACGNTDTCVQTVTVIDDTPPVITCPDDTTIECDVVPDPGTTGSATATDNCDATPDITYTDDTSGLTGCNGSGDLLRTWMAEDNCGNIHMCVQTITVVDTTPPVITCPDDITMNADPGGCTGTIPTVDTFDFDPSLCASQAPGCYYVDRYAPAGFASEFFDGDNRLKHSISIADSAANRPGGYSSAFYNTQGRKYDLDMPVGTSIAIDMYIPSDWETNPRRADFWATTFDASNGISGYPIIGFTSDDPADPYNPYATTGTPRFRIYTQDVDQDPGTYDPGWTDLGLPAGFVYDEWYTLEVALNPNDYTYTITGPTGVSTTTFVDPFSFDSIRFGNVIIQALNMDDGAGVGVDYDVYWDNLTIGPAGPVVTDNCGVCSITYERSDNASLTWADPFPTGTTTVTWTAEDCCGHTVTCDQLVTVNAVSDLVVDLALLGSVNDPTTRCITFELWDCGVGGPPTVVTDEITFVGGSVSGHALEVPCGNWTCITARDKLHTLRRTLTPLGVSGTQYVASFGNPLIGGNLNDDEWVDILDFGVFNWQYGVGGGDTDCLSAYPHADIDGDGIVDSDDFSFIQINFLATHDPDCCGTPAPLDGSMPVLSISVADLIARGMGELAAGDLNNDGWLDEGDVVAFMQGARPNQLGVGGVNKPLMQFKR